MNFYIKRSTALFSGIMGSIYSVWLIYAAGLNYLLMAVIFMAVGIPVYIWAKKQHEPKAPAFSVGEGIVAGFVVVIALFAIYAMARGIISV